MNIILVIDNKSIIFLNSENLDIFSVPNPFLGKSFSAITSECRNKNENFTNFFDIIKENLKIIQTKFNENLNKIFIAANGFYCNLLQQNGIDNLKFLPFLNERIGSEIICKLMALPDRSCLVDCGEKICIITILGEKYDKITAIWDTSYSKIENCAVMAALHLLCGKNRPIIYLSGDYKEKLTDYLENSDYTVIEYQTDYNYYIKAIKDNSYLCKINLQKSRLVYCNIADSEEFQDNLILEASR